MTKRN
jgi:hypothetical protein